MDIQDNSSTAKEVIDQAISALGVTYRKNRSNFWIALNLFKDRYPLGVYFDEFRDQATSALDLDIAVRKLVFRLKEKLEPYGYTIRRRSIYEIVPMKKKK